MALDHESTSSSDHTSDFWLARPPSQDTNSLAELVRSGRIERVVVVGAGVAGLLTAEILLRIAADSGQSLRIVLVDDCIYGPSAGSGGWHMAFANPDPRVGQWSHDSFEMWNTVLADAGLDSYRRRMPSLIVSNRRDGVPLPPGHPGHASPLDPELLDLRFWAQGAYIDDGSVLSTCSLMPSWRRRLAAHPAVVTVTNHLTGPDDIRVISESFNADVVIVTAGPRARFLLNDQRVQGDFGVLLRGSLDQLAEMHKHIVIMDEDLDEELTYSIPHHECGHVLFGGVCGIDVEEALEFEQIRAGNVDLTMAPEFARIAIDQVYARIRERMPALARALPTDPTQPGAYWFGLRPRSSRVITEWQPATGAPMLVIGGLGGSGFTIGPAVVLDALRLPLPPESQVFPGNTKVEEED